MAEILLVEKRRFYATPVSRLLKSAGHVTVSSSFGKALLTFSQGRFAAIALDWPEREPRAWRLARAARDAGVPVLAIANRLVKVFHSGREYVSVLLEKPAKPQEVAQLLCALVDSAGQHSGGSAIAATAGTSDE
jgi:DNA-binding response OmpR family regulator